jgi:hypothetical protein
MEGERKAIKEEGKRQKRESRKKRGREGGRKDGRPTHSLCGLLQRREKKASSS